MTSITRALTLFFCLLVAPAAFGKKSKAAKNLFLSYEQLNYLNLDEQLDYFENVLNYLVTYEKLQDKALKKSSKSKKSAHLFSIESFLDLLPEAHAQQSRTCICGTYAGMLTGGKCNTPVVSSDCGSGKFTCNPKIFSVGSESTCVSSGGSCSARSNACVVAFRSKASSAGLSQAQYAQWSKHASEGLTSLRMTGIGSGTVESHCSSAPRDKDCIALASMEAEITKTGTKVYTRQERLTQMQEKLEARQKNKGYVSPKGLVNNPEPIIQPGQQLPPPTGDCMQRYEAQLGPLACVACGLEQADPSVAGGGGASQFVALLGVVSQTYDGPHKANTAHGKQKLLEDVIDRLASYGYCTNSEYGANALSGAQNQSLVRGIIDGRQPMTSGWWIFKRRNKQLEAQVFSSFGIQSQRPDTTSAYAQEMFNPFCQMNKDRYPDQYRYVNCVPTKPLFGSAKPPASFRQVNYHAMAQGHYTQFPGAQFSRCAQATKTRSLQKAEFDFCQANRGLFAANQNGVSASYRFKEAIYRSCGMGSPRKERTYCPRDCVNSTVFGYAATRLPRCESGDGPPDRGGPSPGGKGGEKESDRGGGGDSGKGGESSSSRGGGGSDSKGGENSSSGGSRGESIR